jgi:hypothetical protein
MIWLSPSHNAQSPRICDACGKLPASKFQKALTSHTERQTLHPPKGDKM